MFSNTFTTRFTLSVLCFVYIRNCLEVDDQFMKFWDNYIMSPSMEAPLLQWHTASSTYSGVRTLETLVGQRSTSPTTHTYQNFPPKKVLPFTPGHKLLDCEL